MYERKMYQVQPNMERQCITEDSEVRVYLSGMHMYEKVSKTEKGLSSSKALKAICRLASTTCSSVLLTMPIGKFLIEFAYKERGYEAYGGEYIAIVMAFLMIYSLLNFVWKKEEEAYEKFSRKHPKKTDYRKCILGSITVCKI